MKPHAFGQNRHFFTMSCHGQTYQNYQQPQYSDFDLFFFENYSHQVKVILRMKMRYSKYVSTLFLIEKLNRFIFWASGALLCMDLKKITKSHFLCLSGPKLKAYQILIVQLWTTLCLSYFTLFISDSTMTAQKSRLHSSDDVTNNMTGPSESSWVCPPPPWFW